MHYPWPLTKKKKKDKKPVCYFVEVEKKWLKVILMLDFIGKNKIPNPLKEVLWHFVGRRGKKAFLSNQCKEIEENNTIGKTRDLFKKMRATKGTFHAKMSSIKNRNDMDLAEAEDIKKRWQEYTEELYKKDLHNPDNHYGVITHLKPDILECEVKWALGTITMTKLVIEFQLSYFKS